MPEEVALSADVMSLEAEPSRMVDTSMGLRVSVDLANPTLGAGLDKLRRLVQEGRRPRIVIYVLLA